MKIPTLTFEKEAWQKGLTHVAGLDEAGRGALAGPVVAAAVIFTCNKPKPKELRMVRDSKTMTARERERLYGVIIENCVSWGAGIISHEKVDEVNIVNATLLAMQQAVSKLAVAPQHLLVDGYFPAARLSQAFFPSNSYACIVKGDAKAFSIAAASILAKVTRDRIMKDLHTTYPKYGFAKHKGYGTDAHYGKLLRHGPSPVHRRTFYLGE